MTTFTGILYGQLFTPAVYAQDWYPNSSQNGKLLSGLCLGFFNDRN